MKNLPLETDFIVVGAGIAGLRASVELASAGRVLCLVSGKSRSRTLNTRKAELRLPSAMKMRSGSTWKTR